MSPSTPLFNEKTELGEKMQLENQSYNVAGGLSIKAMKNLLRQRDKTSDCLRDLAVNGTAPFPLPVWSLVQHVLVVDHSPSHTEIQADTSVSPAALTIHFHKVTGGEANLQDGAPGHCVKASPCTTPCFRCQGCQRGLTRAESGFP